MPFPPSGVEPGFPASPSWQQIVYGLSHLGRGFPDPLEEGMATYSSIFAWRIPMDRGVWWATIHGVAKSRGTTEHGTWEAHQSRLLTLEMIWG